MVMINPFDLIGDTDIDDPLQIALAHKKAAAAAAAATAADDDDDAELPLKETEKGVLDVPRQGWHGQDQGRQGWHGQDQGRHGWHGQDQGRHGWHGQDQGRHGQDVRGRGPEDSAQELGKPSIRGHSDQPFRGRDGGRGRGRGYLNRDNEEYAGRPARRQFDHKSGFSSPHAKVKGELSPLVKDVPVPQVELGKLPEQNLEENLTLEGKSLIPKEPVELDNAPSSNALNKDKQGMVNGRKEKEPEVKVMTLGEYQKVLEEKRKTLVAMKKTKERKVDVDKEFESMQQLVVKKENNEFFIKLGNDKEAGKRKEDTDEDERVKKDTEGVERVKKSVISMFEFLRLAEGRRGGRGYSRSFSDESIRVGPARDERFGSASLVSLAEDARQFPALGGKEVEQHNLAQWKKVEQQHSSAAAAQGKKV